MSSNAVYWQVILNVQESSISICSVRSIPFVTEGVQLSDNRFSGHENHSVILVFPVIFIRLAGQKDKA